MKPESVIFDMDGLMFDTEKVWLFLLGTCVGTDGTGNKAWYFGGDTRHGGRSICTRYSQMEWTEC